MEMNLVLHQEVDEARWDELVRKHNASVFSESTYLNAVAENWTVLTTPDFSAGMVVPFTVRAGKKVVYAPFFHRYTEWIGAQPDWNFVFQFLQTHFPIADFHLKQSVPDFPSRKYQSLESGAIKLNQQAKRSLKKAVNFSVTDQQLTTELGNLVASELSAKIKTINTDTLQLLLKLVTNYADSRLVQLNVWQESTWLGGIWLLETDTLLLYLKGTVSAEAKQAGAMYLLMQTAIERADQKQLRFDFGGSNAENVRRFNLSFGAIDTEYAHIYWNKAPWWWKLLKGLKNKWNAK